VCPGIGAPSYIARLIYKIGHYFLDILYRAPLPGGREQGGSAE